MSPFFSNDIVNVPQPMQLKYMYSLIAEYQVMTGGNTVLQTLSRVQTSHSTGTATLSYDIIMKILMPLKLSCRRHEQHLIMTRVVLYPCWIRHLLKVHYIQHTWKWRKDIKKYG